MNSDTYAWKLVRRYGEAWERHSEAAIRELFHPDATYAEKPFASPFCGIDAILVYWRTNRELQRDVTFHPLRVIESDGQIVAEWVCNFFRVDLDSWLDVKGMFWVEFRDGQITRFVEYYGKRQVAGPRVPAGE